MFKNKPCSVKVSIKVAHKDKDKMLDDLKAHNVQPSEAPTPSAATPSLPDLQHIGSDANQDDWITFDKPFNYFYAGKGPFVSQDLMQFPVSHPDDGLIDVVISERVRTE